MAKKIKFYYYNHLFPKVHYLDILIPKGNFSEPLEKKGVMECLINNLLLYSKNYKDKELKPLFDILGSNFEISTSEEFTLITLQVIEENLEKAVALLFESFFNAEFKEKKLKSVLKTLSGALKISFSDPQYISECHLFELAFGKDHPLGKNQTIKTLKNIKLQDLNLEYENLKETKDWAIFISSPWEKEKVLKSILEIIEKYEFKNKNSYNLSGIPINAEAKARIVPKKGFSQVALNLLIIAEPRISEDYIPLKISFYNFAEGGFSSRILRKIRVEMGSTYGVIGEYNSYKEIGYFQISGMVNNNDFPKAVEVIKSSYEEWKNDGISEEELEDAKAFYLNSFKTIKDDPLDYGSFLLKNHLYGFPENYDETLIEKIKSLKIEDIKRAHQKLPYEIPFWCFLGDEKIIKPISKKIQDIELKDYFDFE